MRCQEIDFDNVTEMIDDIAVLQSERLDDDKEGGTKGHHTGGCSSGARESKSRPVLKVIDEMLALLKQL